MTGGTLRQALAFAARGWPVLPCLPGQKIPATAHGYRDATTDPGQINEWFGQSPGLEPGHRHRHPRPRRPRHRRPRPGRERVPGVPPAQRRRAAGRRGHLRPHPQRRPARLLHRLAPAQRPPARSPPGLPLGRRLCPDPALPHRRPPLPAHRADQAAAAAWTGPPSPGSCNPSRQPPAPSPAQTASRDLTGLARWVASQPEGNRNAGLFWAANRALDADPAADLSQLADAARQAGLGDAEITRTLNSARNTTHRQPDHQAEAN